MKRATIAAIALLTAGCAATSGRSKEQEQVPLSRGVLMIECSMGKMKALTLVVSPGRGGIFRIDIGEQQDNCDDEDRT